MSSVFKLWTTSLLLWSLITISLLPLALLAGSRPLSLRNNFNLTTYDQPDIAVYLDVTNFNQVLKDTPVTYTVVEFFAHWCPACRNYKPHYEKVARLFNGVNAVHPGIILMSRVDCANKINTMLCDKFSVNHYPSMFWGVPSKFVSGGWNGKNEKSEIRSIDDGRTAERLLKWINTRLESSYSLEDVKYENDHLHSDASEAQQGESL